MSTISSSSAAPVSQPGDASATTTARSPRGRGRPRSQEADRKILEATLAVLRDRGPDGVTIEAVADASGSAKTTIYRRYHNSDALRAAALDSILAEQAAPPEGTCRQQLLAMLLGFQRGVEARIGRRAVASLLTEHDTSFGRAMRHRILEPRLGAITAVIERGQAQGEIPAHVDPRQTVLLLAGAYFTEALVSGRVAPDWAERALAGIGIGPEAEVNGPRRPG